MNVTLSNNIRPQMDLSHLIDSKENVVLQDGQAMYC